MNARALIVAVLNAPAHRLRVSRITARRVPAGTRKPWTTSSEPAARRQVPLGLKASAYLTDAWAHQGR